MRKTLTVDNGSEFAQFKEYEEKTGLDIYFAKRYSPWQRGANENTNGLLRQYLPKGSDFKEVTKEDVHQAVKRLNNRPVNISTIGLHVKYSDKRRVVHVVHLQFEFTRYTMIELKING